MTRTAGDLVENKTEGFNGCAQQLGHLADGFGIFTQVIAPLGWIHTMFGINCTERNDDFQFAWFTCYLVLENRGDMKDFISSFILNG